MANPETGMNIMNADEPAPKKPLRLLPGVVAVALQWLVWFVVPIVVPDSILYAVIGGVAGGLVVLGWWLFFSRAPWSERVGAIVLMVVALFETQRIAHESIANAGRGKLLPIFAIPVLSLALVSWAVATRRLSSVPRRSSMVGAILLACGVFALVRTGWMTGDGNLDLHWRWTKTPEQRLLAQAGDEPAARPSTPGAVAAAMPEQPLPAPAQPEPLASTSAPTAANTPEKPPVRSAAETRAIWPAFRRPNRDGVIRRVWI